MSACDIISQMENNKEFDFKKVSKDYQVLDSVCLCSIFNKLSRHFLDITGFRLTDFLTSPHIASEYIKQQVNVGSVMIASQRSVDAWERNTIQGGKCFPQKGYLYSCDRQKIHFLLKQQAILLREIESFGDGKEKFSEVKQQLDSIGKNCYDYLEDMDMTSLYPTEMVKNDFPVYPPRWEHDEKKIEEFRNRLNDGDETIPLAKVECDVDFKEVPNEYRIFALMSSRN